MIDSDGCQATDRSAPLTHRDRRAKLDIYINKIVDDEPHLARVKDISSSGLYLYKLLEPEHLEKNVALELQLPADSDDDIIWAAGEVVRENNDDACDGVAVRFTRMADVDRERILRFIDASNDGV